MASSKELAGLVGLTIVAMIVSEFPLVQPHLYDTQIPPVVYLSGVLMFVAGLAIVRVHNRWTWDWSVLITLAGWCAGGLGRFRMFEMRQVLQMRWTSVIASRQEIWFNRSSCSLS